MNITNPDESLAAWERDTKFVLTDPLVPEIDRDRVLYEMECEHAQMHDAVAAYYEARFMRIL